MIEYLFKNCQSEYETMLQKQLYLKRGDEGKTLEHMVITQKHTSTNDQVQ